VLDLLGALTLPALTLDDLDLVLGVGTEAALGLDLRGPTADVDLAVLPSLPDLGAHRETQQEAVYVIGHVEMHGQPVDVLDLDDRVEGRRSLALEYGLLRPAPAGLVIAQSHGLDATHEVRERGVGHEIGHAGAVGGADELHAALGDGPGRGGVGVGADLVDHNHLGHVVFHSLDHHIMLLLVVRHLHAPGMPDGRVRHVAIARDLIVGVHNDHAAIGLVGKDAGHLAKLGGLADARLAEKQDIAARVDDVADDVHCPEDRAAHPASEADHLAEAIAHRGDAMERSLDACTVVTVELAHALHHVGDVLSCGRLLAEVLKSPGEAGLHGAPEIHDDLEQLGEAFVSGELVPRLRGKDLQEP